jgi:hypothetical protein
MSRLVAHQYSCIKHSIFIPGFLTAMYLVSFRRSMQRGLWSHSRQLVLTVLFPDSPISPTADVVCECWIALPTPNPIRFPIPNPVPNAIAVIVIDSSINLTADVLCSESQPSPLLCSPVPVPMYTICTLIHSWAKMGLAHQDNITTTRYMTCIGKQPHSRWFYVQVVEKHNHMQNVLTQKLLQTSYSANVNSSEMWNQGICEKSNFCQNCESQCRPSRQWCLCMPYYKIKQTI